MAHVVQLQLDLYLIFLHANESIPSWGNLSKTNKTDILYNKMHVFAVGNYGEASLPCYLSEPLYAYSNYRTQLSCYCYPKSLISNDLPGISLRVFGKGFAHYRPVIGWQNKGWWIFSWPRLKILDSVDCSNKRSGSWQTYVPIYNFACYNVIKIK